MDAALGTHDPVSPRILLHGFTGSGPAMRPLIDAGLTGRILAPDLIGHGDSPAPAAIDAYRAAAQIEQINAATLDLEAFDLIGYSMGARLAISFAVEHPDRVRRLVLLSGRAGIADPLARAARVRSDAALAEQIEREGIETFAARWGALPIFASQTVSVRAAQHALRIRQRPAGLANSLRGFGAGAMPPLHAHLATISMPVCLLAGALDPKFMALARDLEAAIAHAQRHVLDGVGHAMHLEAPARTVTILEAFLRRPFP